MGRILLATQPFQCRKKMIFLTTSHFCQTELGLVDELFLVTIYFKINILHKNFEVLGRQLTLGQIPDQGIAQSNRFD